MLCEVKTINILEIEASRRSIGGAMRAEGQLSDGFFGKLRHDLVEAQAQMNAYACTSSIKRIAYIIVNFDDAFHEYSDRYRQQIDAYIKDKNPTPDLEVVFDIKPAYYVQCRDACAFKKASRQEA